MPLWAALWMRFPQTRMFAPPGSPSKPSSDVSKMSLPNTSMLYVPFEIPSAVFEMLLWATTWPKLSTEYPFSSMPSPSKLSVEYRSITDDGVVGDVPVASASLQVDGVVIVEKRAATDDDSRRRVLRHQRERLISERQAFQPYVTGRDVDAGEQRLAIASCLPHDVPTGRTRFGKGDASAVVSSVYEKDIPRLRDGLTGRDASEWICRGPVPTAGPGNDMKAPAGRRHHRNRPCRDHDGLLVGTAVGIRQGQPDLVRRVRIEEEDTAREHVGATVVDANEWQRRTPPGGPGDSKLHRRRGVMVGIADKIPLNTD